MAITYRFTDSTQYTGVENTLMEKTDGVNTIRLYFNANADWLILDINGQTHDIRNINQDDFLWHYIYVSVAIIEIGGGESYVCLSFHDRHECSTIAAVFVDVSTDTFEFGKDFLGIFKRIKMWNFPMLIWNQHSGTEMKTNGDCGYSHDDYQV